MQININTWIAASSAFASGYGVTPRNDGKRDSVIARNRKRGSAWWDAAIHVFVCFLKKYIALGENK
jgi:hypothetical protein